ncbi:hypothetical protein [Sphingomonas sp. S2-65]|uniref:hypothetical protein n=1 Tax=Sphingomonas sp. S2-65 TaxID=2903960 RepID=UPI001F2BB6F6|nr:hypothetical protein [Sphingomonas sp. S2-65]UYY59207.1 hypothetical protein LZ586_03665 [Sphingomonas sp. S2-65]
MNTSYEKQKKLHFEVTNVGLRAHATAVGLVQLCIELQRAKVLDEPALDRIKTAIADEVSVAAPRAISCMDYRRDIKARLDRLFAGEQELGSAEALAFGAKAEA